MCCHHCDHPAGASPAFEALLAQIVARLDHIHRNIHDHQEANMANFAALNEQLNGLGTALDEAVARIDADFQALRDQLAQDATDQAAVDAATETLAASVGRLRAIDPDPSNPPTP